MLPSRCYRAEDVESALAEAEAIQQAVGNETNDKQATSRCQNPFCRIELCNSFASYCEGRSMCQRYRALRMQCLVNGESAAIQQTKTLGRSDSFLTVQAKQHVRSISQGADGECDNTEANMPFVIPRRKCPGTCSEYRSVSSREMKPRKTANRDTPPGTNQQTKPRLGPRMHCNEVLALFEPRTAVAKADSASSSTRVHRVQQALRRPRTANTARKRSVPPRPLGIFTPQPKNSGGGGRYVQSGNRPSLNSMRGLALIPRPDYIPRSTSRAAAAAPSAGSNASGAAISVAQRGLPSRQTTTVCSPARRDSLLPRIPHHSQDHSFTRVRSHSTRGDHTKERRMSREYWQSRLQLTPAGFPRPSEEAREVVGMPAPPSISTSFRQRESFSTAESYRLFTENGEHFRVQRALRDEGNCGALRNNCDRDTAVDSNWMPHREREQEERNSASGYSRASLFHSETRADRDEDINGIDESSADLDWPQNWPNSSTSRESVAASRVSHSIDAASAVKSESSGASADWEPTFSFHDAFIRPLLSLFIQKLPSQLESVMNVTKRPRKVKWYVEYSKKVERACKPFVFIQMQSTQVVVMVQNRVWLELKGPSTILLLQETFKTMRAEAISWRQLKSEVEECLELYRNRAGDDVDMSNVFLRAWNNLKSRPSSLSLPRQSNYFCGSRLHHWKFVVGKVEIGSGSHKEKREAFRLATISAADFLLKLDDGRNDRRWRPHRRDSFSSESSEECEFLYVRNVNSESVAADAAITLSDDSPNSATTDVSIAGSTATPRSTQDENAVTTRDPTSQVDDSDTEDEELPDLNGSAAIDTSNMTVEPAPPILDNSAASTKKTCNMRDVIRMRKSDSAGCRQCQIAEKANPSSSDETKEKARATEKAPRVDSAATVHTQPFVAEPSAQPPPKKLKRIFDS